MTKGDIVLIPFPFTDLSGKKVRPALVLYASARGEDCIVAFISSIPKKNSGLFAISAEPSKQNGLKASSHIRLDKLATLEKKLVIGGVGSLDPATQKKIALKLKTLLGL